MDETFGIQNHIRATRFAALVYPRDCENAHTFDPKEFSVIFVFTQDKPFNGRYNTQFHMFAVMERRFKNTTDALKVYSCEPVEVKDPALPAPVQWFISVVINDPDFDFTNAAVSAIPSVAFSNLQTWAARHIYEAIGMCLPL